MNNVIEYFIKARDMSKAGLESALNGIRRFTASTNAATAALGTVAKKSAAVAMSVGSAFGMMGGKIGQAAHAISSVATAALAFGAIGAAVAVAQAAISIFAQNVQKKADELRRATAKWVADCNKRFGEIKQGIMDEIGGGIEAVTEQANALSHIFDRLANKRVGLQNAVKSQFSADSQARLLKMQDQMSAEVHAAPEDRKAIVQAEWQLKIAKEKKRVTEQEGKWAAQMEAEAIARDEKRVEMAKQAAKEYDVQYEKVKERYDLAKEGYGIQDSFTVGIKKELDRIEKLRDAKLTEADDLSAKIEIARAQQPANEASRANQLAAAVNVIADARRDLAEANDEYDAELKKQVEQAGRELMLIREKDTAERLATERRIHDVKLRNAREELQESEKAQGEAQNRLVAAQSKVAQAWGWYRDTNTMQSAIDDYNAQKEAEVQWAKDFDKLKSRNRDWRNAEFGTLSAEDEATRQVALAKEGEVAAQKALDEIVENTSKLKEIADALAGEEST